MLSLKDGLCLLAILVAYGIAGRIDDDVETPREAQHAALAADGAFDEACGPQGPMAPTNALAAKTSSDVQHLPREAQCLRDTR